MRAYICDRCGEIYTKNEKVPALNTIGSWHIRTISLQYIMGDDIIINNKKMDLCDECIIETIKFLNIEDFDINE